MTLRLAVVPLQGIVVQLTRLHPHLIHDELRAYFRDIYDHVFRVNESISAMREMLGAAISVNLALVTFGQNEVIKKLAGWAALSPLRQLAILVLIRTDRGELAVHHCYAFADLDGSYSDSAPLVR